MKSYTHASILKPSISPTAFEIRFFPRSPTEINAHALTSCDKPTFALLLPLEGPPNPQTLFAAAAAAAALSLAY
jgi:hypothetical protein